MKRLPQEINDRPFAHGYYQHVWYVLLIALYLFCFFLAERLVVDAYWVSYLPADDLIPFCEWFVIPYVLWYPFLVLPGVYLLLRDVSGFKQYILYIFVSFMSCILFCILFPNGQNLRPESFPRENILTGLVAALYQADTNTNVLPSMHVLGCMAVVIAVFRSEKLRRPLLCTATVLLALLIVISTVFIKQHSLLDLLVAIPWGFAAFWAVYVLPEWIARHRK